MDASALRSTIAAPPSRGDLRWLGAFRKRLFGIPDVEVTLARRGICPVSPRASHRLEQIGRAFVQGYHSALESSDDSLGETLNRVDFELRGFAFEGAGMALYLLDRITPWKRTRFADFLAGAGQSHVYMVYVGAGWAMARLRRRPGPLLARMDPLLRWLAIDGLAFHEAYFHPRQSVEEQVIHERLTGYERRAFDQGLGRGMWFAIGADVRRIANTIRAFSSARHSDLWSGVGLAAAYAGGVDESALCDLRGLATQFAAELAQGAAFAAKCRQRAGNPAEHTDMACSVLCGMSASDAAAITDESLLDLPSDAEVPACEIWRRRIQSRFTRARA